MSVKVAVRVRPFNQREKDREPTCCVRMVSKDKKYYVYKFRMDLKQYFLERTEKRRNSHLTILSGHMTDLKRMNKATSSRLTQNTLIKSLYLKPLDSKF